MRGADRCKPMILTRGVSGGTGTCLPRAASSEPAPPRYVRDHPSDVRLFGLAAGHGFTHRVHEIVERILGDAEPQVLLFPELEPGLINRLEFSVLGRKLIVELVRGLVAGFHDRPWQRA